jgi:hypothetical protein
MLKKLTVICGLLLAATAAMAGLPWPWMPMDSTPYPVGQGAHITYGVDRIWGMFPVEADTETYVYYYYPLPTDADTNDPNVGQWYPLPDGDDAWIGASLAYTGMTFQWGKELYVIGADTSYPDEDPDGILYHYSFVDTGWGDDIDIDEDDEFVLDEGACIAYAPNLDYGQGDQAEGWIYILPGNSSQFWRYSIEPDTDIVASGIFPPSGSTIADQTPLFRWTGGSILYRLQVSTDPGFGLGSCVIDTVVSATEYQTPSKLANAEYYWRTGTPNGLNWIWASALSFTLEGGFERVWPNIPEAVHEGAAMAYTRNTYFWDGHPSILVLAGGTVEEYDFYRWDLEDESWTTLSETDPAPKCEMPGTSLTTCDPVCEGQSWFAAAAAFGAGSGAGRPWGYQPLETDGNRWFEYPDTAFQAFPKSLGPGATFVMGPSPWCYLTTGAPYVGGPPTKYFYAIDPAHMKHKKDKKDKNGGGSQAGDVHAGNTRAQVLASSNGVEVEYQLPAAARVRATLHDAVGRQVGVLDAGSQQPGTHRLSWNQDRGGRKLASGVYLIRLDMNEQQVKLKAIVR